jgi:pimeloyl-ACP methyl ester carboxylesterase
VGTAGVVERFTWEGYRLAYEVHGDGPRTFVFLHGLLLDSALNRVIAALLAEHGHRVILPELLGHGRSDKPRHAYAHRMELWADQTVALLDHLDLEEAVVGGVSLGANVTLHVAHRAPERVRAMIVEMPVLERGTMFGAAAFLPVLTTMRYLPFAYRPISRAARLLPDTGHPFDSFVHLAGGEPREIAAVLHGLFVGAVTPPEADRRRMEIPALVLGHGLDVLHAMDDARALARELPQSRFLEARSILEARTRPTRVVSEMDRFLDEVWQPRAVRGDGRDGGRGGSSTG